MISTAWLLATDDEKLIAASNQTVDDQRKWAMIYG
jgi:hypothetical protein